MRFPLSILIGLDVYIFRGGRNRNVEGCCVFPFIFTSQSLIPYISPLLRPSPQAKSIPDVSAPCSITHPPQLSNTVFIPVTWYQHASFTL
jgi:hypothetical protein